MSASPVLGASSVVVVAVGLWCPLGSSPRMAAMCARAGQIQPRITPFGGTGRTVRMCQAWDLPADSFGLPRMLEMAARALADALRQAPCDGPTPLLLALPTAGRADDDTEAARLFAASLCDRVGLLPDPELSYTVRGGSAATAALVQLAARYLEEQRARAVVVGGVDSHYHPELLRVLDAQKRIIGSGGRDVFLPSEAAAFLVLVDRRRDDRPPVARLAAADADRIDPELLLADRARRAEERRRRPTRRRNAAGPRAEARLRRAGLGTHRATRGLRRLRRALGESPDEAGGSVAVSQPMVDVVQRIVQAWPSVPIDWVLTDLNHTRERTEHFSVLATRLIERSSHHTRWLDQLGDVGAATGPCLAAMASAYWAVGCAPAPAALIALHSEDGQRGAILLRAPADPSPRLAPSKPRP